MLPAEGSSVLTVLIVATLLLSTFISNTAAANLLLPIGISFALQQLSSVGAIQISINIALIASLAMALPISTPPNTIAYSKDELSTTDFVRTGAVIGILAMLLIIWLADPIISFWIQVLKWPRIRNSKKISPVRQRISSRVLISCRTASRS